MPRRRTDAHRPTALVTEDYEFVGCGYYGTHGDPGYSPLNTPIGRALIDQGWHFGENESAGDCYHCGARLTYYAIMKHKPTHTLVRIGEQCLDNRFELSTDEFHSLRRRAQLNRQRVRLEDKKKQFLAASEDNAAAVEFVRSRVEDNQDYGYEGFYFDLLHKFNRYGELSERQVAAALRAKTRHDEREARRAAERASASPCPTGTERVEGEVLSVKSQENAYGVRIVMTVRDDRGFKVWGTVPSGLSGIERGNRVSFTANLEQSDRDETFGFFKRPRNAEFIES